MDSAAMRLLYVRTGLQVVAGARDWRAWLKLACLMCWVCSVQEQCVFPGGMAVDTFRSQHAGKAHKHLDNTDVCVPWGIWFDA